ncbi:integral membrane protein [Colletotrichum kahawae]|uniref:Integral membrane protein n=1 Tax=Colletotrichum kahawae TaxID=34407 RepID=A0AAE0D907_COLKA|nr:integral membrane protein [Colletotrichum kahawae]
MKAFTASALAAALYAATASADPVQACPNDVCFKVAVPQAAASSGSGNLYFQMSAPTSYQWVALGTGSTMSNSNMFIMYTDGAGNVTISPRTARGHNMPTVSDNGAALTLLGGSGVSNGKMVANVLCTNCASWSGGSMSLNSASTSWIAAWKSGSAINSASNSQSIQQHDDHSSFTLDLTSATVSSDSNPFTGASTGGNGSGSGSSGGGSTSGGSGVVFNGGGGKSAILLAHGVIMSIVFVALYPLGAMLMPLVGKWMAHAVWQSVAFALMWVGFGTGYAYARDNDYKFQGRGIISHVHIWYGRALMILGIINGGLGLKLANTPTRYVVAYSVPAAILGVMWLGAGVWGEMRRTPRMKQEHSHESSESQQRIPYRQKK